MLLAVWLFLYTKFYCQQKGVLLIYIKLFDYSVQILFGFFGTSGYNKRKAHARRIEYGDVKAAAL
jgi:hypothetical protein